MAGARSRGGIPARLERLRGRLGAAAATAGRRALVAARGETAERLGRLAALTVALAVLVVVLYDHGDVPSAAARDAAVGAGGQAAGQAGKAAGAEGAPGGSGPEAPGSGEAPGGAGPGDAGSATGPARPGGGRGEAATSGGRAGAGERPPAKVKRPAKPAEVAAAWYAARHKLPRGRVRPLQQDRVSARQVRQLDGEEHRAVVQDPVHLRGRGRGEQLVDELVAGVGAHERLHGAARPALGHGPVDGGLEAGHDRLPVRHHRQQRRLVEHGVPDQLRMALDQTARDRGAAAVADDHCRCELQGAQQRGRVVGLLGHAGGGPAVRPRAAGHAAPVVGDHREPLRQSGHHRRPLVRATGAAGDEQQRRSAADHLVVQLGGADVDQPLHGCLLLLG
jgi:hypothetical protein